MYNAGSLPGRLFGNLIAQRLGPQKFVQAVVGLQVIALTRDRTSSVLIFSNVTAGILTMLFVTIRGAAGMFVFAFVFGFFTGIALFRIQHQHGALRFGKNRCICEHHAAMRSQSIQESCGDWVALRFANGTQQVCG